MAIRTSASQSTLTRQLREILTAADPTLPIHEPQPLDAMIAESVVRPRFNTWLLGSFGALALVLASLGIYGVVAYGVSQRRNEIGVRLALGATPLAVVRMVVAGGMRPVIAGLVLGLVASVAATRLLAGLLCGVTPTDAATFIAVAIVLGLAGVAAAYVPAQRAAGVDPLSAIRAE
jgi:ABC-type antimicrobial peptide transport system permease subunit